MLEHVETIVDEMRGAEPSGPCARSRDRRFHPPIKNPSNDGLSALAHLG
jgi:hypothetical protein